MIARVQQDLRVAVPVLLLTLVSAACSRSPQSVEPRATVSPTTQTTTLPPTTYEPYAGTNPAVAPTGSKSVGQLRTVDGRSRTYRLYVPSSLDAGSPAPLLVALHGGLGTSAQFEANSGFDELAEANRFVVVYPDGIGARSDGTGPQTWNGGYCCGPAARADVDDVGFLRQLLAKLTAEISIDPTRTYAAGHSNGAIMAYRLACELSDRIVAIGVQAGSLGIDSCAPGRPVSVIHLHGTADTNHPIDGGTGSGVAGVKFRPARDAVEALAAANGCIPSSRRATDPSNPDLTVATWTQCSAGTVVRFVKVNGATHAWMGHPAYSELAESFVGKPYMDIDASRAIWSFLAAHSRR